MIFVFPVTTPANTAESAKQKTALKLTAGHINFVELHFPPGVNALAHLSINYGLYQLFPSNQDADFSSGSETIDWIEDIELDQPPFEFVAYSWNDDDTYEHTITVRISITTGKGGQSLQDQIAALLLTQTAGQGQ